MVTAIATLLVIQGSILLAAAKSIFITRRGLYDQQGITNFVTRIECEKHKAEIAAQRVELDRRKDLTTRMMCVKMDELKKEMFEIIKKLDVYIASQKHEKHDRT